jgi:hypothetical protein
VKPLNEEAVMATVSRIYGADFTGYLAALRASAQEVDAPIMREKLNELCAKLEPVVQKLAHDYPWPGKAEEAERWVHRLDDLQGSLAACTTAQGVGSMCRPFYDKIDKLIRECSNGGGTRA